MKKNYIDAQGEVLLTPHRNNDCCCGLYIIWKNGSVVTNVLGAQRDGLILVEK